MEQPVSLRRTASLLAGSFSSSANPAELVVQVVNLRRVANPAGRGKWKPDSRRRLIQETPARPAGFDVPAPRPIENRPRVENPPHNFRRIHESGKTKRHWVANLRRVANLLASPMRHGVVAQAVSRLADGFSSSANPAELVVQVVNLRRVANPPGRPPHDFRSASPPRLENSDFLTRPASRTAAPPRQPHPWRKDSCLRRFALLRDARTKSAAPPSHHSPLGRRPTPTSNLQPL